MNDDAYYQALAIMDRINDEVAAKFNSASEFSLRIKCCRAYWSVVYPRGCGCIIKNLIKYAEALDVSVEYLLSGKNKAPYRPVVASPEVLIEEFKKVIAKHKRDVSGQTPKTLSVFICRIAKKQKSMDNACLYTLLYFEDFLKIPAYRLAFREV